MTIFKSCSVVFAPLIAMLTNLSFSEGKFLNVFKFGQVIPLLKKPRPDDKKMTNFRPITNLNTTGKILERLLQNHINRHIQGSPNFGLFQSAYRALHSTEMAMMKVVNDLLAATDNKTPFHWSSYPSTSVPHLTTSIIVLLLRVRKTSSESTT